MSMNPHRRAVLLVVASLVLVAGSALTAEAQKKGGILKVGNLGEPPALDAHWTTASITETLTNHIYEGLYSLDSNNRPIPMLAESHTVSKDGLVYTFKLRQGVKFHNGKEMTSDDAVRRLQVAQREAQRLRRRQDRLPGRGALAAGAGGGDPRGPGGDRRARLRRRPEPRRLRPAEEEPEHAPHRRQAVLLARRGP